MKIKNILLSFLTVLLFTSFTEKKEDMHLFILSGQSNMELLNPDESFLPILESKFEKKTLLLQSML